MNHTDPNAEPANIAPHYCTFAVYLPQEAGSPRKHHSSLSLRNVETLNDYLDQCAQIAEELEVRFPEGQVVVTISKTDPTQVEPTRTPLPSTVTAVTAIANVSYTGLGEGLDDYGGKIQVFKIAAVSQSEFLRSIANIMRLSVITDLEVTPSLS